MSPYLPKETYRPWENTAISLWKKEILTYAGVILLDARSVPYRCDKKIESYFETFFLLI